MSLEFKPSKYIFSVGYLRQTSFLAVYMYAINILQLITNVVHI